MRTSRWGTWTTSGIALCCLLACGGPAPEPEPEDTAGHEDPPPPPPPPPAATLHVIHASPDPGLASFTIRLDEDPALVTDLAAGTASDPLSAPAGTHTLHLLGVASVETGEAPEVLSTPVDLASGSDAIVLVYGEPSADPPLAVSMLAADTSGTATRARLVHGLEGVGPMDVCLGTSPIATGLAPGAITQATPIAEGDASIALHAASDNACRGRALGVAHVSLTAGGSYVITIAGHAARRGHATGNFITCTDTATVCTSAAIGTR